MMEEESAFGFSNAADDVVFLSVLALTAGGNTRGETVKRHRVPFATIAAGCGGYFKRACRMTREAFEQLHSMLFPDDASRKGPNGGVETRSRLSMGIRHMAGGDPLDIMSSHHVGHSTVFDCLWEVCTDKEVMVFRLQWAGIIFFNPVSHQPINALAR